MINNLFRCGNPGCSCVQDTPADELAQELRAVAKNLRGANAAWVREAARRFQAVASTHITARQSLDTQPEPELT